MNEHYEYIQKRIAQAQGMDSARGEHQVQKWLTLAKYLNGDYLSFQEKLDFIRHSLESWRISSTTVDVMFRKMIRWTLPGKVAFTCLDLPENNGNGKKTVLSRSTPGLTYTVSREKCDCPGFRGEKHCYHHDDFLEELVPVVPPSRQVPALLLSAQEIIEEWDLGNSAEEVSA